MFIRYINILFAIYLTSKMQKENEANILKVLLPVDYKFTIAHER